MSGAYGAVGDDAGPPPRGGSGGYDRGGRGGGRGYGGGGGYQGGDRGGDRGVGYQGGDRSGDRGGGYQGGDRNGGRSGGGGYQGGDRGGRGGYQGGDRGHRGGGSGGGRGGGRGGREGDWVCPDSNCANVNFARRTECNKCGTPNPAGSGGNSGGGGYNNRGNDSYSSRGRGGYNDDSGERGGSYGKPQGRDGNYGQAPPVAPVSYGGQAGSYPPASNTYPSEPQSQASGYGGAGSYPPTYGAPPPTTYSGQDSGPRGGFSLRQEPRSDPSGSYASANVEPPAKVKQCDENCDETCDNARIYISNLPSDITIDELRELFGGIGLVGKIKQKRGYKDQWPWNIKIYTDDDGKNKGDACLAYEDPSAAHSAGGFFNNYELRGHKIGVTMAEKSAPKAPAFGHGGGGRGGYGGGRRYNDGGSGPDRHSHGGQRSRPY